MPALPSTISPSDWLIIIVESTGSDLLDMDTQSKLFSITGTGEQVDPVVGQQCQDCLRIWPI